MENMSSGDPSQVDSVTLLESMRRDFAKSQEGLSQFFSFFQESQVTLHELLRRASKPFEIRYKAHIAGPKPQGQRHFICEDCDKLPDCPMLEDEVWFSIPTVHQRTLLCIACVEKALGRRLEMKDLRDCVGNAFTFLVHDRLMRHD